MKFTTRLKPSTALIDMTPLVDVIFLMLIFFIVTSDILPLKSLLIEHPKLGKDSAPITTQLLLVMDKQHILYLGTKKHIVDLHSLKEDLLRELELLKSQNNQQEPTLVLSIDKHVDYGMFLTLFSIAQECCSRLRLVYQPSEPIETFG